VGARLTQQSANTDCLADAGDANNTPSWSRPLRHALMLTGWAILQQVDGGGRKQRREALVGGGHRLLDARVLGLVHILGDAALQRRARIGAWRGPAEAGAGVRTCRGGVGGGGQR
jgi:hypothetical protein